MSVGLAADPVVEEQVEAQGMAQGALVRGRQPVVVVAEVLAGKDREAPLVLEAMVHVPTMLVLPQVAMAATTMSQVRRSHPRHPRQAVVPRR